MKFCALVVLAMALLLAGCMMAPMGMMMMGGEATGSGHGGHGGSGNVGHDSQSSIDIVIDAARLGLESCAAPIATAILIEDALETPGMLRERQAQLGVPPLVRTARRLAEDSGCFRLLDPDPLLFSLPGAVQPDILLRVRFVNLELIDRSGVERAWRAAQRRAGRYLSNEHSQAEALRETAIGLAIVCPRERRIARDFTGRDDATSLPQGADAAKNNQERIALAYGRAHNEVLAFLRAAGKPCG